MERSSPTKLIVNLRQNSLQDQLFLLMSTSEEKPVQITIKESGEQLFR